MEREWVLVWPSSGDSPRADKVWMALSFFIDFGINFETAFVARLNESGYTNDDGSDETAIEIIGYGTERGG